MSIFSVVKSLIGKVNEHTQLLKDYNADIEDILDRLEALDEEVKAAELDPESEGLTEEPSTTSEEETDEEALKLVE